MSRAALTSVGLKNINPEPQNIRFWNNPGAKTTGLVLYIFLHQNLRVLTSRWNGGAKFASAKDGVTLLVS